MRTIPELKNIERFVKSTHNSWMNRLIVDTDKKFDPEHSELGYCYKYECPETDGKTYFIVCANTGNFEVDFRVYMHEIGHLYLGHLDEVHKDLDTLLCNSIRDNFDEISERINQECGIDFGQVLLKRIIDDPFVNHSFHNISMDMEVNSRVLSDDDIHFMETEITKILPKKKEEALKLIADKTSDSGLKQEIEDELKKMEKETKIKFILPSSYHTNEKDANGNEIPFPNGLSYTEYLLMMLKYADQFVKSMVSLDQGGDGNTSGITQQQIQDALNKWWDEQSEEYKQGYQKAMEDMKNGMNPQGGQQSGQNQASGQQSGSQDSSGGNTSSSSSGSSQGQSEFDRGYSDALSDLAKGMNSGQGKAMRGLDSLMSQAGLSPDPGQGKGKGREQLNRDSRPYSGNGTEQTGGDGKDQDFGKDHFSDSRQAADNAREKGEIRDGGGVGCGKSGGSDREVEVQDAILDDVDAAIGEIMKNVKNRVLKITNKRDPMRLYNRGIERKIIRPVIVQKVSTCADPKIVFLVDVSGSMDQNLIVRILKTISHDLRKLSRALRYDIIAWNTRLSEHIKDIDPKKEIPKIRVGGGTSMAEGMKYFKEHYDKNAILVVVSDFEDNLSEWHEEESRMIGYDVYGWNYGRYRTKQDWTRLKQRNFSDYGYAENY